MLEVPNTPPAGEIAVSRNKCCPTLRAPASALQAQGDVGHEDRPAVLHAEWDC